MNDATTPPLGRGGSADYTALKGVGRALAVIELLARAPMKAKDVADRLGLKWTTAYRTLAHLEEQGYLRRDVATGEYAVGPGLYRLGAYYLASHPLAATAPPYLSAVVVELGCAAQANERYGMHVLTVAAVDSPTRIQKTSAGFTFPLGVAAKGLLLLAHAPEDVREAVLARPPFRGAAAAAWRRGAVREELARIRAEGWAVASEDVQPGVGSVAAAVRGRDGEVLACVSLIVPSARIADQAARTELRDAAGDAAHAISCASGWRPS